MQQEFLPDEKPIKKFISAIAWFFVVLVLICLPGDDLPELNNWFHRIYFDKWVHAGIFGLLALLFMLPVIKMLLTFQQKKITIFKIALSSSVWGLTTEFIQRFFVPGRQFDWGDWLADSAGVLIAWLIVKRILNKQY